MTRAAAFAVLYNVPCTDIVAEEEMRQTSGPGEPEEVAG